MYVQTTGPRFEYRDQEAQRAQSSPTLADQFPDLKSLTVELGHYNPEGVARNSNIKFCPNLDNARSVFRIDCPNKGCIGGDFDLTETLADAVATQKTTIAGELCCQGWLSRTTINTVHCHNILRYKLHLEH